MTQDELRTICRRMGLSVDDDETIPEFMASYANYKRLTPEEIAILQNDAAFMRRITASFEKSALHSGDDRPLHCHGCEHHTLIADPDPYDSFCKSDVAVVCKLAGERTVERYCGPFEVRKVKRPSWCPLPHPTP